MMDQNTPQFNDCWMVSPIHRLDITRGAFQQPLEHVLLELAQCNEDGRCYVDEKRAKAMDVITSVLVQSAAAIARMNGRQVELPKYRQAGAVVIIPSARVPDNGYHCGMVPGLKNPPPPGTKTDPLPMKGTPSDVERDEPGQAHRCGCRFRAECSPGETPRGDRRPSGRPRDAAGEREVPRLRLGGDASGAGHFSGRISHTAAGTGRVPGGVRRTSAPTSTVRRVVILGIVRDSVVFLAGIGAAVLVVRLFIEALRYFGG